MAPLTSLQVDALLHFRCNAVSKALPILVPLDQLRVSVCLYLSALALVLLDLRRVSEGDTKFSQLFRAQCACI